MYLLAVSSWPFSSHQARPSSSHTLIFAVSTLHLLMHTLLHLALEDTGPGRLVVVGDLQDVGSVDPVIGATAHDMVARDIAFVHWNLPDHQHHTIEDNVRQRARTLLYVALYTLSAMVRLCAGHSPAVC